MKAVKISYISIIVVFSIWISLNGCTSGTDYEMPDNNEANLILSTRIGEITESGFDENIINSVRAIVFEVNGNNNNLVYIRQIKNQIFTRNELIKLTFEKCNQIRVLLIANEKSEWELNNTNKTADDIKKLAVVYGDYKREVNIKSPFVMFSESNILSGQIDNALTLQLIRNIARVDLSLTCKAVDVVGLNNGELRLTGVRVERMAPLSGLGIPYADISHTLPEDYLTGSTTELIEGTNYFPKYESDGTFKEFTTEGLKFYVPEHYVTDTKTYTYITIFGKYIPKGATSGIPVEYNIPLGSDITQKKIEENLLTLSELTLERNNLYDMKASFKSLQQVSEVYVNVIPWSKLNVNGSINEGKYYLNISNIDPSLSISNDTAFVQFWSNLNSEKIRILPTGVKEDGAIFQVNDFFVSLADEGVKPDNIEFVENEMWGRLRLVFKPGMAEVGKVYVITLAAGQLERTIRITATNVNNENE